MSPVFTMSPGATITFQTEPAVCSVTFVAMQ
jgi:hypothetical protein